MANNIDRYLEILYQNLEDRNTESYEEDREFLGNYIYEFESFCEKYARVRGKVSEKDFLQTVLDMAKREYDPKTKIAHFAEAMLEALETNDIFMQKFDLLMGVVNADTAKKVEYRDDEKSMTPLTIGQVYKLTEEFLDEIDEERNLSWEFKYAINAGKIELIPLDDGRDSHYSHSKGAICYKFDGTVNSAHTLLHEFMHHISYKEAQTNMGYNKFTLFREFLSIYYEKAFIQFMDEKGLLPNGPKELLASRLKSQEKQDPSNCLPVYLELSNKAREKQNLSKEDILAVLSKYLPNKSAEELWDYATKELVNFADEHYFGMEVAAGLTTYLFSTTMAYETKTDKATLSKMHKLAGYVKDGQNDIEALQKYFEITGEQEKEFVDRIGEDYVQEISVRQIGRRCAKTPDIIAVVATEQTFSKWDKSLER